VRYYAGADYSQKANEEVVCLVMIEDIKTVGHLEELTKAPAVDGFYIGPTDMALSMGMDPNLFRDSKDHARACQRVLDVAKKSGLIAGVHCWSAEEAAERTRQGFMFCPAMNDVIAITATANAALKTVRGTK
jgi:4-hydroxy-2-oxoheptanedioate aldolase